MADDEDEEDFDLEQLEEAAKSIEIPPIPRPLLAVPGPAERADQLDRDIWQSRYDFRRERLNDLRLYKAAVAQDGPHVRDVVERAASVLALDGLAKDLAWALHKDRSVPLRYLTSPPISSDDLKTLAESTIAPKPVGNDADAALRIRHVLRRFLDGDRFPWIEKDEAPDEDDLELAAVATTMLLATRRVETARRGVGSSVQEKAVKAFLVDRGFEEKARKTVGNLRDGPGPGEFMPECVFGGTRADFLVGAHDGLTVAIECKASNSAVNSYKRLVHEAGGKAQTWLRRFGDAGVKPAAVIAGVYKRRNVETAMAKGLTIVWAHRMEELGELLGLDRA